MYKIDSTSAAFRYYIICKDCRKIMKPIIRDGRRVSGYPMWSCPDCYESNHKSIVAQVTANWAKNETTTYDNACHIMNKEGQATYEF